MLKAGITFSLQTLAWGIDFEYMPAWKAALLFLALASPVVLLGMRSMAGLGPVKKWVAIGVRLAVLLLLVMILAGARWQRRHKTVEVLVLRDISQSAEELFRDYPGRNVDESVDDYLLNASADRFKPNRQDRIGVVSFSGIPLIDSMLNTRLVLDARAIREHGQATDIASAIQLALATFQHDAMRRLLLITDGNQNAGDIESALAAAAAQQVPIDVMPLHYAVQNEVVVERISAPSWRREPDAFDIFVSLLSTNMQSVTGKLTVYEEGQVISERPITIDPATVNSEGKVEPRKHVERVGVRALKNRGVRRFKAIFTPEVINTREALAAGKKAQVGDTLLQNNTASAFTFVQGKGRILYIDNSPQGSGSTLQKALELEAFQVDRVNVDQVPEDLVKLQDYDAIILNNVPLGRAGAGTGLSLKHDSALASYVHDFGGGLIMLGGPESFGAGGWQGSKLEEVMPVSFDIPAQRQMPKGALALIIHSCEMPQGNYWGEQCAIKAIETLSSQDEIGVISYDWGGGKPGINNSVWNYILSPKLDGSAVIRAVKKMQPGDMPSFDDTLNLALNGTGAGQPCLLNSKAAQKHIIIISDGDPQPPATKLIQQCINSKPKISISTISVYPHGGMTGTMKALADQTGGRHYGPIENNPAQLPQIFIKEATVVRRTLIQEGQVFPVSLQPTASDIMKGIAQPPAITGYVLFQKKNNPTVDMPLETLQGTKRDPLFAHWQAGLGKTAAFTSDASAIWNERWLSPEYAAQYTKFFAAMVRSVSRPPMSQDFVINTDRNGDRSTITVEADRKGEGFTNFLTVTGKVVDPDGNRQDIRLVQTGPGIYSGEFPTPKEGNYVAALQYTGQGNQAGWLVSGVAVNGSPEFRDLKSNDQLLEEIARRTRGRVLPAFDPENANLFSRENLPPSSSPLPVWDILLPILMALILIDVAVRRIAWDWQTTRRLTLGIANRVRSFTLTRQVESKPTLDALRRVREGVAEMLKTTDAAPPPAAAPDAAAKFEARAGVEGDITQVVGGATSKPIPAPPKSPKPKGAPAAGGSYTGSLLEAKRRAQKAIKKKEQGDQ